MNFQRFWRLFSSLVCRSSNPLLRSRSCYYKIHTNWYPNERKEGEDMQGKNKFQLRREATYAKLMQAGFEVLCEKGFSGASIDDIVSHAGYTKGAFYVHFETKEQFMLDLITARGERRADLLAPLYALVKPDMTLEEVIRKMIEAVIDYLQKAPKWIFVYVDFFMQARHNEQVMAAFQVFYHDWIKEIQNFIELLKTYQLLPEETDSLEKAKLFYAFVDGSLLHYNFYEEMLNAATMKKGFLAILKG